MAKSLELPRDGTFVGRVKAPTRAYPLVVTLRDDLVVDITARRAPTVRDACEIADPADYVRGAAGEVIGRLADIAANSFEATRRPDAPYFLSPVDLQAVKASGVTFVASLLERVIEEQARGDPGKAEAIRADITALIGTDLSKLRPGSPEAMACKQKLIARGVWSQYLEVGIGPDAEIFSKCPPMASVGFGADVGLHPISKWNNPEPEVAVVASSAGTIVGACLGNDVNLRDVEGRSALLLGKAKDNNASAALGPLLRLFDERFGLDDLVRITVHLTVDGEDGFSLQGSSSMSAISRSPQSLVAAAMGPHHQYPDGMVLYLGTMFVPSVDRGERGMGFTHRIGDIVAVSAPALGSLMNRVRLATQCAPWVYGVGQLMRDLAQADLL